MFSSTISFARMLSRTLPPETIAEILNAWVCAEDIDGLSEFSCRLAKSTFDHLTEIRPDCVELAQNL